MAHRFAWEQATGEPLEREAVLIHSCDTPACVNPAHLRVGTSKENVADKTQKGRQAKGERVHNAKLSADAVRSIRARYRAESSRGKRDGNIRELASEFGVTTDALYRVLKGNTWRHVG